MDPVVGHGRVAMTGYFGTDDYEKHVVRTDDGQEFVCLGPMDVGTRVEVEIRYLIVEPKTTRSKKAT